MSAEDDNNDDETSNTDDSLLFSRRFSPRRGEGRSHGWFERERRDKTNTRNITELDRLHFHNRQRINGSNRLKRGRFARRRRPSQPLKRVTVLQLNVDDSDSTDINEERISSTSSSLSSVENRRRSKLPQIRKLSRSGESPAQTRRREMKESRSCVSTRAPAAATAIGSPEGKNRLKKKKTETFDSANDGPDPSKNTRSASRHEKDTASTDGHTTHDCIASSFSSPAATSPDHGHRSCSRSRGRSRDHACDGQQETSGSRDIVTMERSLENQRKRHEKPQCLTSLSSERKKKKKKHKKKRTLKLWSKQRQVGEETKKESPRKKDPEVIDLYSFDSDDENDDHEEKEEKSKREDEKGERQLQQTNRTLSFKGNGRRSSSSPSSPSSSPPTASASTIKKSMDETVSPPSGMSAVEDVVYASTTSATNRDTASHLLLPIINDPSERKCWSCEINLDKQQQQQQQQQRELEEDEEESERDGGRTNDVFDQMTTSFSEEDSSDDFLLTQPAGCYNTSGKKNTKTKGSRRRRLINEEKNKTKKKKKKKEKGGGSQKRSYYAIHAHPLLHVSTCVACVELAYAVEDDAAEMERKRHRSKMEEESSTKSEEEIAGTEMDICSWCAGASPSFNSMNGEGDEEEEEPLLLCDNCPRVFCLRCVALAHGGGKDGWAAARKLIEDHNDDTPWACLLCDPPSGLRALQTSFLELAKSVTFKRAIPEFGKSKGAVSDGGKSKDREGKSKHDDDVDDATSTSSSSTTRLVEELNAVEDELEEAIAMLEGSSMKQVRKNIELEILSSKREHRNRGEIQEEVDREVDLLRQQWEDHHTRLLDAKTAMQDALEAHGIDLSAFYKFREKEKKDDGVSAINMDIEAEKEDDNAVEPDWKTAADVALDKRDEEMKMPKRSFWGASGYKAQNDDIYDLDPEELSQSDVDEIEDINKLSDCVAQLESLAKANEAAPSKWSSGKLTYSDIRKLEKGLAYENAELNHKKVDVEELERKCAKEADDVEKELKLKLKNASLGGCRVVRDEFEMIEQKRKREKKAQARRLRRVEWLGKGKMHDASETYMARKRRLSLGKESNDGNMAKRKRRIPTQLLSTFDNATDGIFCQTRSSFKPIFGDLREMNIQSSCSNYVFEDSDFVLTNSNLSGGETTGNVAEKPGHKRAIRIVSIVKPLMPVLKTHQKEGIKFMWDNVCCDLSYPKVSSEPLSRKDKNGAREPIRGCILAHNMGLGKSLQVIALLHALLTHPSLVTKEGGHHRRIIRKVLLIVPVNTLANWEDEFEKWIGETSQRRVPRVMFYNLNSASANYRDRIILRWSSLGGVLCVSSDVFAKEASKLVDDQPSEMAGNGRTGSRENDSAINSASVTSTTSLYRTATSDEMKAALLDPGPDVVVLDEAHTMLKNNTTNIFKSLSLMQTKRRVALTGTPLQNNLFEYFHMANWVRPNCLGTEYQFNRKFNQPIMNGMAADSTPDAVELHTRQSKELYQILSSFVQRRDANMLSKELPFMQQVVIHVRQSKMQAKLYRAFRSYQKTRGGRNLFWDNYHKMRPVNNHPGCLLIQSYPRDSRDSCRPRESSSTKGVLVSHTYSLLSSTVAHTPSSPGLAPFLRAEAIAANGIPTNSFPSESKENVVQQSGVKSGDSNRHEVREHDKEQKENFASCFDEFSSRFVKVNVQGEPNPKRCSGDSNARELKQPMFKAHKLVAMESDEELGDSSLDRASRGSPSKTTNKDSMAEQPSRVASLGGKTVSSSTTSLRGQGPLPAVEGNDRSLATPSPPKDSKDGESAPSRGVQQRTTARAADSEKFPVVSDNVSLNAQLKCQENNSKKEHNEWWEDAITKHGEKEKLLEVKNGGKIVLLLQILAHADLIGDKVVVFTQCIKTLNYIEQILNRRDWGKVVPSIASLSPGRVWGPWRKNSEYLRIDGGTTASERGELITQFNEKAENNGSSNFPPFCDDRIECNAKVDNSKLFLLSTLAGGVGINLVAANRVVLFDSHWNPAIDVQAVYRCYRYGQEKPVFVYRLLTEGTMEEKIYSRSVNKSGLAARVIDQTFPERSFTSHELNNLLVNDTWVCCDRCDKWRMLPPEADAENLPEKWYCEYNTFDKDRSTCKAKERDARWYSEYFEKRRLATSSRGTQTSAFDYGRESIDASSAPQVDEKKAACTQRDQILLRLLSTSERIKDNSEQAMSSATTVKTKDTKTMSQSWISKYYFHDSLLEDSNEGEGMNKKQVDSEGEEKGHRESKQSNSEATRLIPREKRSSGSNLRRKRKLNSDSKNDSDESAALSSKDEALAVKSVKERSIGHRVFRGTTDLRRSKGSLLEEKVGLKASKVSENARVIVLDSDDESE